MDKPGSVLISALSITSGIILANLPCMTPREVYFQQITTARIADGGAARSHRGQINTQHPTTAHQEITFSDVLEFLNPLNHIPVVSQLYHQATGEKPSAVGSLVSGALLGGPIGFAVAAVGAVFEEATGQSVIGAMLNPATETEGLSQAQLQQRYHQIANAHRQDLTLLEQA